MGGSNSTTAPMTIRENNQNESLQDGFNRKISNQQNIITKTTKVSKFAEVHLGKLSPDHYHLGKLILQPTHLFGGPEGLDILWSSSTFIFTRKSSRTRDGFGFHAEITLFGDDEEGKFIAFQKLKPKRNWLKTDSRNKGVPDGPVDIFDTQTEKQVLGVLFNKKSPPAESVVIEGSTIFSIPGVLGVILIRDDWTTCFEIKNIKDEVILIAERFNRLSGGFEFQISSVNKDDMTVCVATLVRLEESKFILKIYAPFPPFVKALMLTFVLFLMYLMVR